MEKQETGWKNWSIYKKEFVIFLLLMLVINPVFKALGSPIGVLAELVSVIGMIQLLIRYVIHKIKTRKK